MTWAELWPHLWPGFDAIWPNILASIICGSVVWLWARRHVRRLHRKHDELHAAHKATQVTTRDTNRIVRVMADQLGIDPNTGENRLPQPRY